MGLFVVGNCIPVFVVQIAIRLTGGLIWLIVVPHTVVIFVAYSALIQSHILIGRELLCFRKACCFHTEYDSEKRYSVCSVFIFVANFHVQ